VSIVDVAIGERQDWLAAYLILLTWNEAEERQSGKIEDVDVDVVETRQPCILLVHDQHADDPRLLGLHSSWKFRLADRTCSQHLSEIGGACNHFTHGERHVRVLTDTCVS
jgi:hypothetical protein